MKNFKLLCLCFVVFSTTLMSFGRDQNYYLGDVQQSQLKWTGVAVSSSNRIFASYPRGNYIPFSVGEIVEGEVIPYPNGDWNNWSLTATPNNHFIYIQSIYMDKLDNLWILDAGCFFGDLIPCGAKLVKVDLETDSIVQVIYFNAPVVRDSCFLSDVRVDTDRGYAYITDSGLGAIIVVNLATGESRRLLEGNVSVLSEDIMLTVNGQVINWKYHVNGLALTQNGDYLYYKALSSYSLYRIPTEYLRDTTYYPCSVAANVQLVCSVVPSDGMEFDMHGNLYLTGIEDNSIYYLTPGLEFETAIVDSRLKYPDSFSITQNNEIYVSTSRTLYAPGTYFIFKLKEDPSGIESFTTSNSSGVQISNYPNPFQNSTTIQYQLKNQEEVDLRVVDLMGKEVKSLVNQQQEAGTYEIEFDGSELSNGIYFCILRTKTEKKIHKIVIEK
ncbi:MAG TPA: L-dopachrome tautomerase-related protein [Bacteroidales bacterium]|nr:L-dopachrome tautomerase-related protein [Bacteroidales bacterium]HPS72374.1 L-dopachrome tautomerase-related protein [Bacteroidales bacterium]